MCALTTCPRTCGSALTAAAPVVRQLVEWTLRLPQHLQRGGHALATATIQATIGMCEPHRPLAARCATSYAIARLGMVDVYAVS
jgi:hypothetical protein